EPASPQHTTTPLWRTAHPFQMLTVICTASVSPATATGVSRAVVVPSPTTPKTFRPQHTTPPVARSAQVASAPTSTATASARPATVTGMSELVSPRPDPSTPVWPSPQHHTVPLDCLAHVI